ncbi:hypothetical protein DNHGIG_11580 [Collibacillus ludicampi]|uniref:YcdB/YcdC repeated domain-containing protein n=1 Tax=Collibacillus ludicampi TaxID=2771369 RepID=A0AAV4LD24_9BACL|nr:YcdB/YcdC domain-containing protein [Collibacillus ludicampi]GIM45609.1 hypothetical protein DNHGIG_11580 [Collibacillus ludicampi]
MKNLQKLATATVLAAVVSTVPQSAWAEQPVQAKQEAEIQKQQVPADVIQKDQAIAKVRNLFDGLKELPYAEAYYVPDHIGMYSNPVWSLTFSKENFTQLKQEPQKKNEDGPRDVLHAILDAKTGQLLNFSRQNPDWIGDKEPSAQQARQAAADFLKKIAPDLSNRVQVDDVSSGTMGFYSQKGKKEYRWRFASVNFYETVHGIPFHSNCVSIHVDPYGHVVGMNVFFRFDSSKLPDPAKAIPLAKAEEIFSRQLKMNKMYMTGYTQRDENGKFKWVEHPVLMFTPNNVPPINALTGQPAETFFFRSWNEEPKKFTLDGLGKTLQAENKEEAKRLVTDFFKLDLTKFQFEEQQDPGFESDREMWNFNWTEKNTGGSAEHPKFVHATFDAKSGQLMGLFMNENENSDKPTITLEEGQTKALEFLKSQLPTGEQEIFLMSSFDESNFEQPPKWYDPSKEKAQQNFKPEHVYSYTFNLGHQGVPIADLGYSVQIDAVTGQIVGVYLPVLKPIHLPDNKNTVSEEVAKETFLHDQPLHLLYNWPEFHMQIAPEGQLLYEPDFIHMGKFSYIDAFTGKTVVVDVNR